MAVAGVLQDGETMPRGGNGDIPVYQSISVRYQKSRELRFRIIYTIEKIF